MNKHEKVDWKLIKDFAHTYKQKNSVDMMIKYQDRTEAFKNSITNTESSFRRDLDIVLRRASEKGINALPKGSIPEGYSIKGKSTLYDENGNVKIEWVKTDRDKEELFDSVREAFESIAENNIKPAKISEVPKNLDKDLLCDYTIGDAHIGMYAWAAETDSDWDTQKGVDIMRKAANYLVSSAPAAETAFILDVGDYFHADNQMNETSKSKNKLDVDGRWKKVMEVGIQAIGDLIDLALQKHNQVYYRSVIGNHNEHSAVMLNIAMKIRYRDEPRVTVLDSPKMHHYFQFGVNLLADTHGHTTKADKLPLLMATDQPKMWAETTNRVWRTGHVHHESVKEYSGCNVVTYRTLSPKDAWHAGDGYRSNRDMRMTVYHKTKGTASMKVVNPSMIGY